MIVCLASCPCNATTPLPGLPARRPHKHGSTMEDYPTQHYPLLSGARGFAGVALGCLLGLSAQAYWVDWQGELTQARSLAQTTANSAAEQIGGSLRTIDLLIQSVGRSAIRHTAEADIENSLGVSLGAVPEMRSLILTDAEGGRIGPPTTGGSVRDRDYFSLQKAMYSLRNVVIDGPLLDSRTGKTEIVLSRPLIDGSDRFNGVIAAVLRSDFFFNPLMAANLEGRGTATLFNINGVVFNRFPEAPGAVGTIIATGWMAEAERKPEEGTARGMGLIDEQDSVVAYRAIRNYPLTVAVSVSVAAIYSDWLKKIAPRLAIEGIIGLMLVGFATLFDVGQRKRRHIALELAELNRNLEQRVAQRTASLQLEVNDRIRAEQESARLENAYRDLFEGSLEGLAICRSLQLILTNQSFSRMFGTSYPHACGTILDLIAEHHRLSLERAATSVFAEGDPAVLEVEGCSGDGRYVWYRTTVRRVEWEGQSALQVAFIDISAMKKGETQMLAAKQAAESANELKSRFLAVASHDLRQPAQAIALYANVLRKRASTTDMEEIAVRLADSSNALSRLLDSLLDISKLEAGSVRPHLQYVQLRPLLEHLWGTFSDIAEQSGVSLSVVPAGLAVESDPVLLGRILQNLVSNAVSYTPRGGKVLVGCRRQGEWVSITVLDNGVGISIRERERVFQEFYRSTATARKAERGLGLGLSIVRRLMQLLGHTLALTSEEGRGSAFTVTLKQVASLPEANTPAPPKGVPEGCRILLVDDDSRVRDSLELQLREWNIDVFAAAAGAGAVQAVAHGFRPDLVLVDRTLGDGEQGQDVVDAVQAVLGQPVSTIMLTGDTAPAELAADGWSLCTLHKPIRPDDLLKAITIELAASAGQLRDS